MWRFNSVEFSPGIQLKDLPSKNSNQIFRAWLERIGRYYLDGARSMDDVKNGFASMTLQLCALDALGTLILENLQNRERVKKLCRIAMMEDEASRLTEAEIGKAARHLYYQYRCGLVHNGFTMQVGRNARNNERNHIFLMSYESGSAVSVSRVVHNQNAFIVNPILFRENLERMVFRIGRETNAADKEAAANRILFFLADEIRIAGQL